MFTHEQKGCIANIIFVGVIQKTGAVKRRSLSCSFASFSDAPSEAELWSYSTSNLDVFKRESGFYVIRRRPRRLNTPLTGAGAADVLRFHLTRREQIARAGGFHWKRATLRDALDAETRSHNSGRTLYARMTPLRLAWLLFLARRQKISNEWLGELRGKL